MDNNRNDTINKDDFQKIELKLDIILPEAYKEILLNYPSEIELLGGKELPLKSDSDWLIEQNLFARENPAEFFFGKEQWPSHYFVIGEDGNGNCFYLNLHEQKKPAIYFLDHEQPDLDDQEIAVNFSAWISMVHDQLTSYKINAEQRIKNETARKKKRKSWWRF